MRSTLKINNGKTKYDQKTFYVQLAEDDGVLTLSIDNGEALFSIPFNKIFNVLLRWNNRARN